MPSRTTLPAVGASWATRTTAATFKGGTIAQVEVSGRATRPRAPSSRPSSGSPSRSPRREDVADVASPDGERPGKAGRRGRDEIDDGRRDATGDLPLLRADVTLGE